VTAATGDATRAWGTIEHKNTGVNADFAAAEPGGHPLRPDRRFQAGVPAERALGDAPRGDREDPEVQGGDHQRVHVAAGPAGGPAGQAAGLPDRDRAGHAGARRGLALAGFGDFKEGYQIVDRIGIRTLRDPYTNKPFVIFYSTKRVGGGVLNFEAIKLIQFS
jgi:hypothetical protein